MAFHHRKQLKKFDSCSNPCVPNHGCSADCNHSPDDHSGSIHPIGHKPSILILTFCVLGAAFGIFCYLTIVKYYSNWINSRRRNSPTSDGDDIDTHEDFFDASLGPVLDHPIWYINTVGLQESIINSITIFKYKKDEGLIEGTECSVCLNEFQEDESLRLLPKCSHAFHIPCIDTWLRSHKNCPLCRAPIVCDSNHAQVGSSEPNLSDLGSTEETQVENLENFGGLGSLQVGESEMRVGPFPLSTEEETIDEILEKKSRARICKSRVLSDLGDHNLKVEEELQPRRRSVSMDSASASMIYLAMANIPPVENEGCSHTQLVQVKKPRTEMVAKRAKRNSSIYKLMKSSSIGRSLQKGTVSMKRSFSSSGKLSFTTVNMNNHTIVAKPEVTD